MSSDQRYQSHLFNFLRRQSRELKDQLQRNARQAKMVSFWGMQMAIYPVYLLFQVTRLSEQALRQADVQGKRLLKAALDPDQSPLQGGAPDLPIRRVLDAIQILPEPADGKESQYEVALTTPQAQRPSLWQRYQRWFKRRRSSRSSLVQGLAADVASRHLILIAADNEPLDVLVPSQQHKLLQLMTWEVAHYQRQQRLNRQLKKLTHFHQRPLSQPAMRSQMLPPVRGFRKVMGWFQASPLAATTNLFKESQAVDPMVLLTGQTEPIPLPENLGQTLRQLSPQITPEALQMLDVAIASLEARTGAKATADLSERIVQQFQQRQAGHALSNQLRPSSSASIVPLPITKAFGWLTSAFSTLFGKEAPLPETMSVNSRGAQSNAPNNASPSISWTDLYGMPTPQPLSPKSTQTEAATVAMATLAMATPESPVTLTAPEPDMARRMTIDKQGIEIEVDAVFVEYEQHTLERILNVLDRVVAWLEQHLIPWLARCWSTIKVYFQQLGRP